MKRRRVVAALATTTAAFAGCLSDGPSAGRDDDRTDAGPAAGEGETAGQPGTSVDEQSVIKQFDSGPERPECERKSKSIQVEHDEETDEYETAATIPYPDPPTTFAEDDVVAFVDAFEEAFVTHDVLCNGLSGHVLRVGYDSRERETFDWDDDVTVVFLLRAGGATRGLDGDGYEWVADLGYGGVVYAVDETGAARAAFDDVNALERDEFESHAPNPLEEGELVATFD